MARAPKYKPEEHPKLIVEMGAKGKTINQFASHIGVSRRSVNRWAEQFPEFDSALALAKTLCKGFWEDQFQKIATGEMEVNNQQLTMNIFIAKALLGYGQEFRQEDKDESPKRTAEESKKRLAEIVGIKSKQSK